MSLPTTCRAHLHRVVLALVLAAALAACTTTPPPRGTSTPAPPAAAPPAAAASAPPAAAAPGAPAATPPARPDAAAPRPFAEVIRDAQRSDGFVPLWRKDDRVWFEIAPERLGAPFLLSVNVAGSVGERGLWASQMGPSWLAEFRRVGNNVQLVALNTAYRAEGGDAALQRAVREAFSDSLLAYGAVASAPHPERKSVLVDAAFLLADLPGYSTALERAFRLAYSVDRGNSQIERARTDARLTTLNLKLHYATPRIPVPPPSPPPGATLPSPPTTLPDPRSLFVATVVNFVALPAQPMRPRAADPRLGHFSVSFTDYGDDRAPNPRVHWVKRWRIEKADPDAALSPPRRPVVFWIDRNVPARYRDAVRAGVLEWNKAFAAIGVAGALEVREQRDDADFDTLDGAHASIRWLVGASFARGPSHADPRSGEIVDADIVIGDGFARGARRVAVEDLGGRSEQRLAALAAAWQGGGDAECSYAADAADELAAALALLAERGEIDPDSPDAERLAQDYVRNVVMHEVGHVLGLTHNFKASTTISAEQLRSAAFTRSHGTAASVMDYTPFNLPLADEPRSSIVNPTIGAYDYWAIEYAYREFAADAEAAGLRAIAARSTEPALAFGDDADAGGLGSDGIDPLANRFDLGDDPLAWYGRRLTLSRELWQRVQQRGPRTGDDPLRLRRSLLVGFSQLRGLGDGVAKYVGGMHLARDLPGTSERAAYRPVEPARQRDALRFLERELFAVDSFRFRPEYLAAMAPDYNEWQRPGPVSVPQAVLQLQQPALDRLLAAGTAQRLLDLPLFVAPAQRDGLISLHEVYATLQRAVWSELRAGGDIEPMRRNLQREHLRRVVALLLRGAPGLPPDAVSLMRLLATDLHADLKRALARGGLDVATRAHLADSLAALGEALRAAMVRPS